MNMDVTEYLKTGEILKISLNMDVLELMEIVGKVPFKKKQFIDKDYEDSYLIYFKDIEIGIFNNKVNSITIDLDSNVFTILNKH